MLHPPLKKFHLRLPAPASSPRLPHLSIQLPAPFPPLSETSDGDDEAGQLPSGETHFGATSTSLESPRAHLPCVIVIIDQEEDSTKLLLC